MVVYEQHNFASLI